uniref:Fatty acyl-CoA reductase n=1 Tax=Rhodnius prolixus TaxID=13249 RepID=T1H873_RHOPR
MNAIKYGNQIISYTQLFDRLRHENPAALGKVVSLYGELTRDSLGIRKEDYEEVVKNVSVVFNLAASLKLEADLRTAVEHNTIGTLKLLTFAKTFEKLEAFVHISTTFCHPEEEEVKEALMKTPVDPNYVIDLLNWMNPEMLEKLRPKILGCHPNCYTFSKALTEKIVENFAGEVPVCIARPSIVVPSLREPMPGWVDSLNGPVGVLVAGGKGVLRSMLGKPNVQAQIIPVDIAINALIIIAWKKATKKEKELIPVYNISCDEKVPITWGDVLEKGRRYGLEYPINPGLWYPNGSMTTNQITHFLTVFLLQLVPAYFIDLLLICLGHKPFMIYVQNRINQGSKLLQYFTMRSWKVHIEKAVALIDAVSEEERLIFYTSNAQYNIDEFMVAAILGTKQYCLREPLSTLPSARRKLKV